PGVPTYHSAQDINALVRDFTKWDDNPVSLQHFAQSMVRAYKMAMTPPYEPVMIALDGGLQEEPMAEHTGGLHPALCESCSAAGRGGRAARDRQAARERGTSRHRGRPHGALAERHQPARGARRAHPGAGGRPVQPDELSQHAPSLPEHT